MTISPQPTTEECIVEIDADLRNLEQTAASLGKDPNTSVVYNRYLVIRAQLLAVQEMAKVDDKEIYYLESIERQLKEWKDLASDTASWGIGNEVLSDNLNWLADHIECKKKALAAYRSAGGNL